MRRHYSGLPCEFDFCPGWCGREAIKRGVTMRVGGRGYRVYPQENPGSRPLLSKVFPMAISLRSSTKRRQRAKAAGKTIRRGTGTKVPASKAAPAKRVG